LPKYGYLLDSGGAVVGAILLICSTMRSGEGLATRCNLSSWYVDPSFRAYAPLLVSQALRHKDVTYLNVSPAPHTRPIIKAQGFSCYCDGIFIAVPMLKGLFGGPAVEVFDAQRRPEVAFDPSDREVLLEHAAHGCISLWCATRERAYPFVFRPRLVKVGVPCAQLIYCRDVGDFVRFAGPVGRVLARRGRPFVIIDANGPIPGLIGWFQPRQHAEILQGPAAAAARRPRLHGIRGARGAGLLFPSPLCGGDREPHIISALRVAAGQSCRSSPCVANSASAKRSMPKATQPVCITWPAALLRFQAVPKWSR
jgi:hypothetical protein